MRYAARVRGLAFSAVLLIAGCAPRMRAGDVQEVSAAVQASGRTTAIPDFVAVVGSARVVGFGVPAPGAGTPGLTSAYFMALVEGQGFSGLALDVDATAARMLDAFVAGAAVDVDAALRGLGEPELATEELRALLGWARAYSLGERGGAEGGPRRRFRVFGLDPRDGDAAAAVVLAYFEKVDPAYVPTARSLLGGGEQLGVDAVLKRLDERREAYAGGDPTAWNDARRQAEVTAQARRMAETWEFEAREFARAQNVEWALAQLDGGKLMVVASNRQIAAEVPGAAPSMGNFLRQWLKADYRAIAASVGGGEVLAEDCSRAPVVVEAGSLEAALAAGGQALALVDLRGKSGVWARPLRLHGEVLRPAAAFDAIWTIGTSRPGRPIAGACPGSR